MILRVPLTALKRLITVQKCNRGGFPMDLNEKETKTALEALYVAAKHHDNLAVGVWCKKLDELGVGFRAQNYIFSEASRDFSPGIPSGKINVAFDIAKEQYAIRRVAEMVSDGAVVDNAVKNQEKTTREIKIGTTKQWAHAIAEIHKNGVVSNYDEKDKTLVYWYVDGSGEGCYSVEQNVALINQHAIENNVDIEIAASLYGLSMAQFNELKQSLDEANPIKKGDLFVSHKGVEAKVVETKSDSYYSGDMSQIRLQFLSGMNEGSKVWYDKKTLLNLFKIKEPVNQVDEIKVKQAVANLLSQYSKDEMLEGDWWVGSSVPIEGVSEYGIDVNVYVSDEEDPESPYSIVAYPLTPTEDGNYVADVSEVLFTHSLTKNELPLWIVSERFNAAPGTLQEAVTSLADKTSSQTLKQ